MSAAFRISTITANGDVGSKVHLPTFFEQLRIVPLGENGIVWAKYCNKIRGQHPDPKRNQETSSTNKHFNHQVTIVYYLKDNYTPNLKLFYTGNVQMTGVKNFEDGNILVNRIVDELKAIREMGHVDIAATPETLQANDFKIRMINSDFKVPYEIRRKELYNILLEHYENTCSYQPESYPGVKIHYFWNIGNKDKDGVCTCSKFCMGKGEGNGDGHCKKVTISLFRSGSILITGATSYEQVSDAYQYISSILKRFENQIRWTSPVFTPQQSLQVQVHSVPRLGSTLINISSD